jgi:hypothetical protein
MAARRSVDLADMQHKMQHIISASDLLRIVRRMSGLHMATVGGKPCMPMIVTALCETAKCLRELTFEWNRDKCPRSVTLAFILQNIRGCALLHTLTLGGPCPLAISTEAFVDFALPQITCLRLYRLWGLYPATFDHFLSIVPNLTSLMLPERSGTDTMLRQLPALTNLSFYDGQFTNCNILLPCAQTLRRLNLGRCDIHSFLSASRATFPTLFPAVHELRVARASAFSLVPHFHNVTRLAIAIDFVDFPQRDLTVFAFPDLQVLSFEVPAFGRQYRSAYRSVATSLASHLTKDSTFMPVLRVIKFCGQRQLLLSRKVALAVARKRPTLSVTLSPLYDIGQHVSGMWLW